jgi:trigger factor
MKISVESVSPVERKVTIEIDPDRVAREIEKAYVGLGRRVKLRGFRPGKAPRNVLERHFKDQVESEVVEKLVSSSFVEAVQQESIDAVAPPSVSLGEGGIAEGRPLRYTARVEVKPRIEPRDYRALEVERKAPEVTEQMVSDELTKLQDRLSELVPAEGRLEAQEGDWAVVDHEGTMDGAPFEGSKAEGVTVRVGPGAISDGNLAALAGKRLGETVEFDEPFAADHRNPALRGKVARMKVTLQGIRVRRVPPLDDEFARAVGIEGVDTLPALRERIRSDLERREKRRVESETREALVKAALARNEFEVPPALVERAIDNMIEGAAERFARSGLDIRQLGLDLPRMRADLREQALLTVRGALLLEAIADAEKLEASEEEVEAEIARMAEGLGVPVARVKQQMGGADARKALSNRIREDKAIALLTSQAKIQEK